MTDTVIEFRNPPARPTPSHGPHTGFPFSGTEIGPSPSRIAVSSELRTAGAMAYAPISIDTLYPATEGAKPHLIRALALLGEAIDLLEKARATQDAKNADRLVMRFQVLLPELFGCRRLGDGYASVVNSLHFAFINQHGRPFEKTQLNTIWRVLKELRTKPFVTFEQALEYVLEFEAADLMVDPPIVSQFIADEDD